MTEKIMYVTKETYEKMVQDLQTMKTINRPNAAAAIAEAREKGDLKENAEYDAAKQAQGLLEAKIMQLESAVANSQIIDPKNLDLSQVTILSKVSVINLKTNKNTKYQIVSESEANFKENKISSLSPIGSGLMGKKLGEVVDINTPGGTLSLKIEEISI